MSLSSLPDELIVKIFGCLIDRECWNGSWRSDYSNLARTCKRFLHLGENNYKHIHGLGPWCYIFTELHVLSINRLAISKLETLENYGTCPVHTDSIDPDKCYYQKLYPLLTFNHTIFTKISLVEYDLKQANCIQSIDNPRFDNMVECSIFMNSRWDISRRVFNFLMRHYIK